MYCVNLVGKLVDRIAENVRSMQMEGGHCQLALKALDCLVEVLKKTDVVRDLSDDLDEKLVKLCPLLGEGRVGEVLEGRVLFLSSMVVAATHQLTGFVRECLNML